MSASGHSMQLDGGVMSLYWRTRTRKEKRRAESVKANVATNARPGNSAFIIFPKTQRRGNHAPS